MGAIVYRGIRHDQYDAELDQRLVKHERRVRLPVKAKWDAVFDGTVRIDEACLVAYDVLYEEVIEGMQEYVAPFNTLLQTLHTILYHLNPATPFLFEWVFWADESKTALQVRTDPNRDITAESWEVFNTFATFIDRVAVTPVMRAMLIEHAETDLSVIMNIIAIQSLGCPHIPPMITLVTKEDPIHMATQQNGFGFPGYFYDPTRTVLSA